MMRAHLGWIPVWPLTPFFAAVVLMTLPFSFPFLSPPLPSSPPPPPSPPLLLLLWMVLLLPQFVPRLELRLRPGTQEVCPLERVIPFAWLIRRHPPLQKSAIGLHQWRPPPAAKAGVHVRDPSLCCQEGFWLG